MSRYKLLRFGLASLIVLTAVAIVAQTKNKKAVSPHPAFFGKLGAQVSAKQFVDIQVDQSEQASAESDLSILKFNITALKNLNAGDLRYTINIPDDVILVDGAVSGDIPTLDESQSVELILKLRNFSKQKKSFVKLNLEGQISGMPLTQGVLVASQFESTLEHKIQITEKKQQDVNGKLQLPDNSNGMFAPKNIIK